MKVLVMDSMKPNKLKRHLEIVHAECIRKTPEFFHRKLNDFSKQKKKKKHL
jgi:hypothetical protein